MCELGMLDITKYLLIAMISILIILGTFFLVLSIIEDIRNNRTYRKIKKSPKTKTDYPYLPLGMVTKHFGWSYEFDKGHGWNYVIWHVLDDGTKISVNTYNKKSRTQADVDCKNLEEHFYGKGKDEDAKK